MCIQVFVAEGKDATEEFVDFSGKLTTGSILLGAASVIQQCPRFSGWTTAVASIQTIYFFVKTRFYIFRSSTPIF